MRRTSGFIMTMVVVVAACGGVSSGPEPEAVFARWAGGEPATEFDASLLTTDPATTGVEVVIEFESDETPDGVGRPLGAASQVFAGVSIDGQDTSGIDISTRSGGGFSLQETSTGFALVYALGDVLAPSDLGRVRELLVAAGLDPDEVEARLITDRDDDGRLEYEVRISGDLSTPDGDVELSETVVFTVFESDPDAG